MATNQPTHPSPSSSSSIDLPGSPSIHPSNAHDADADADADANFNAGTDTDDDTDAGGADVEVYKSSFRNYSAFTQQTQKDIFFQGRTLLAHFLRTFNLRAWCPVVVAPPFARECEYI